MNNDSRAHARTALIEALLVALVFARPLPASLFGSGIEAFASMRRHYGNLLSLIPQTALLIYIIGKNGDLPSFFTPKPVFRDALLATGGALTVLALSFLITTFAKFVGIAPLSPIAPVKPEGELLVFIPLVALSSLAVGTWEELLYRVYFVKKLEESNIPTIASILVSAFLFSAGHAYQGALGVLASFILALVFSLFFLKSHSLYALAGAHAIYDFVVIMTFISF